MDYSEISHKPQQGANGTITREIKITLLQALQRGYFDDAALKQMQGFLFPDGEPIIVEVIDKREQVERG